MWMKRSDLPLGYSGWQVVDATPQEASDGMYDNLVNSFATKLLHTTYFFCYKKDFLPSLE